MVWNPGRELFGRRYIIERKLGEGGIGITYLAKNRRGELRVIKTLREQIFNDPKWTPHQARLRHDFRDEALRLALCRHPHIVQVENVFDEDNLPCMAMEYIEGEDLGKRITEKGALPEAEALQYIRQIGEALILVHEKGLLHRDLKPSNIMMRAGKPEAVLIDFGLARQFISGGVLKHTENHTPGYAPPEQYAPIEQRGEYIDVYAFAATLYSLVTGQLPMPAPARLQNFTLPAPQELNGSVNNRVNEAIMKGMALNYKFRPQSVQEWLDLLGASPIPPTQPVISRSNTPPSWECVHIIPGISGTIALSPKGDILASAANRLIHFFSSTTGQLLHTVTTDHSDGIRCLMFGSDRKIITSGYADDTIKLWDVKTGRKIHTFTDCPYVHTIAISTDGQILASGGDDTITLWDVQTGREVYTLTGHSDDVWSLAISSDGQILASSSLDKTIKIWSIATGREICTLTHSHPDDEFLLQLLSVAFSPDGQILAGGSPDKTIKLWDVQTGREICTLTGHSSLVVTLAFSPDGQILASGSLDDTIKLWMVATGREIRTLIGHYGSIKSITFSNDGQILISCCHGSTIKQWEVQTGREIRNLIGHSSNIQSVVFSSDGQILAISDTRDIKLWEVQTAREIRSLTGHCSFSHSVAFSPDGEIVASDYSLGNRKINLWSITTGEKIRSLTYNANDVCWSLAFSRDGHILASGHNNTINLWSVATGEEIRTLTGHSDSVNSVAISSDGQILASGSGDNTIKLWSVATGEEIRTLTGHSGRVRSVAISSDGQILATGSNDKTIQLWSMTTGKEIRTLIGHLEGVISVAISGDGQILASGSWDNTIKLWSVATGKEICTLSHFDDVKSVAFTPDGNWLAAGDRSGNIKIWRRS